MLATASTHPDRTLHVLLVDDETEIVELLGEYLRARGHTVHTAHDGTAACEQLAKHPLDVVLTDMKMPGLDGLELLEIAQARTPPPGVLVMTGFGTVETATQAMSSGALGYLLKPFRLRDMHAALQAAAHKVESQRRAQRAPALLGLHETCLEHIAFDDPEPLFGKLQAVVRDAGWHPAQAWWRAAGGWRAAWATEHPGLATNDPDTAQAPGDCPLVRVQAPASGQPVVVLIVSASHPIGESDQSRLRGALGAIASALSRTAGPRTPGPRTAGPRTAGPRTPGG